MKQKIIYCIMAMNRLSEVKHCLDLVGPYVDASVVIDGGSIDDSLFYLRNRNDVNVFLHQWTDNFSGQRNNYIKRAREVAGTDSFYCLVSDPDEWFEEETLKNLPSVVDFCEKQGANMAQFQCRSVTLKGEERVWENLDNYWKGLLFKYEPGIKYTGNPHETLVPPSGLRAVRTPFLYEHVKQENIIWHRGCFPSGQRIITNNGYELVEDIKAGDLVLDKDGMLQKVSEVLVRNVDEEIIEIKRGRAQKVRITKEHPILVSNGVPCKIDSKPVRYRPFMKHSHETKGATCCADPNFYYKNFGWCEAKDINFRHIFHYPKLNKSIAKKLPDMFIHDIHSNQYKKNKIKVDMCPDIFRLFGYYLSEGSLDYSNNTIEFSFSVYERESLVDDVEKIVNKYFNRSVTISEKRGNVCKVRFSCVDLLPWVEEVFSKLSWNKRISLEFIAGFSNSEKIELLKGLFLGDGTKSDNQYSISLCSPHLSLSIWIMLIELGFFPSIHEIPISTLNNKNSGFEHKRPMFRVGISVSEKEKFENDVLYFGEVCFEMKGRKRARPSKTRLPEKGKSVPIWNGENSVQSCSTSIKTSHYVGPVYNIEVENTHSYCLPYMAVHNCRNYIAGGGGPNLGNNNPYWVKLREIMSELGLNKWHEFDAYLLKGNIDQRIKDEFIKYISLKEIVPGLTDGLSEMRECYKTYFRIYHNEEETEELKGTHID